MSHSEDHGSHGCCKRELSQEEITRRGFFKLVFGFAGGVITTMLAWPSVSFLVSPFYGKKKAQEFVKVPGFGSMPTDVPTKLVYEVESEDAFLRTNKVHELWVIKKSPTEAVIYSPICPHLSCHYSWYDEKKSFMCPCHGSYFEVTGEVKGGPAPRPLDVLPYKIVSGELFVQWKDYKSGIAEKVEA